MPLRERNRARRALARVAAVAAGATTIFAGAAIAAEPNNTPATATGPLTAGKAFQGSLETINDADFQFFYIPDTAQVTITVTNLAKPGEKGANRRRAIASAVIFTRKRQKPVGIAGASAKLRPGQKATAKVTLGPGKYLLPIAHAAQDPLADIPFRIKIGPAGTTTDSYEIFARRCAAAVARVHRVHRSKQHLAKRLRRAKRKGHDAKADRLEEKLDAKRDLAKVVQRNKRIACSVPR
jgi:hypothetical protein